MKYLLLSVGLFWFAGLYAQKETTIKKPDTKQMNLKLTKL